MARYGRRRRLSRRAPRYTTRKFIWGPIARGVARTVARRVFRSARKGKRLMRKLPPFPIPVPIPGGGDRRFLNLVRTRGGDYPRTPPRVTRVKMEQAASSTQTGGRFLNRRGQGVAITDTGETSITWKKHRSRDPFKIDYAALKNEKRNIHEWLESWEDQSHTGEQGVVTFDVLEQAKWQTMMSKDPRTDMVDESSLTDLTEENNRVLLEGFHTDMVLTNSCSVPITGKIVIWDCKSDNVLTQGPTHYWERDQDNTIEDTRAMTINTLGAFPMDNLSARKLWKIRSVGRLTLQPGETIRQRFYAQAKKMQVIGENYKPSFHYLKDVSTVVMIIYQSPVLGSTSAAITGEGTENFMPSQITCRLYHRGQWRVATREAKTQGRWLVSEITAVGSGEDANMKALLDERTNVELFKAT